MENELDKFLAENKETLDKVIEPEQKELYDFSEKKKPEPEVEVSEIEEETVKKVPFNKDEKLQRYIEKQVSKKLAEYEPKVQTAPLQTTDEVDPLTEVLTRIIGNDTPEKLSAIKDFKKTLEGREERVRQEALNDIQSRVDSEKQAEVQALEEVSNALDDIEDTFNVDLTNNTKLRNGFLDFMGKISPKDANGNIIAYSDFNEAFKTFKEMNKAPSNDRAKDLASKSMSNQTTIKPAEQSVNSFDDFDKWAESLQIN